jgi:hypothetical protein
MAHKIKDERQEYQFTGGFTTPSGHSFEYYDTPDNERLVLRHSSGSHLEFKADGSIIIKSLKDIHTQGSILSTGSGDEQSADTTTTRYDTDHTLEVGGTLNIKCSNLNIETGGKTAMFSGTDFEIKANNIMERATEGISVEASKSIYLDTNEFKQRSVTTRQETGNKEDGTPGGLNVLNVHGNAVIQNNDPLGGITISSKGYLNLVCGAERVDVTGFWVPTPSALGMATYTHYVLPGVGVMNKSKTPGDSMTIVSTNNTEVVGLADTKTVGTHLTETVGLNRVRNVGLNEVVNIGGLQATFAKKIFLN